MIIHRQKSKARQISGLIIGSCFALGLIGLGAIFTMGFHNSEMYWSSLWTFITLLTVGIIGARIHGMIWSKKC